MMDLLNAGDDVRRASYSGVFGKTDARQGEPRYGFGDPLHYAMIKHATEATKLTGAVRHAAECYNFYWPQDLDDEFMVVWEGYKGTPWRYLNPSQLRHFLIRRAAEGFVFPLNPKWLLCDEGWYDVYSAMLKNPLARDVIDSWLPRHIQKQISALHFQYPEGFKRRGNSIVDDKEDDFELAQMYLQRYNTFRRARLKLRSILLTVRLQDLEERSVLPEKSKKKGTTPAAPSEEPMPPAKPPVANNRPSQAEGVAVELPGRRSQVDGPMLSARPIVDGIAQLSHRLFGTSTGAPEPEPAASPVAGLKEEVSGGTRASDAALQA